MIFVCLVIVFLFCFLNSTLVVNILKVNNWQVGFHEAKRFLFIFFVGGGGYEGHSLSTEQAAKEEEKICVIHK